MLRPASTLQFSSYVAIFAMVRLIELWTWGSEVYQKVKMESKAIERDFTHQATRMVTSCMTSHLTL